MSEEEFISKRDGLIEMLRKSNYQDNYSFVQKGDRHVVHVSTVNILE